MFIRHHRRRSGRGCPKRGDGLSDNLGAQLDYYLNNRALMTMGYSPRSQNECPTVGNAYPDWLHDFSNKMMVDGNARLVRWEHIMPPLGVSRPE